MQNPRKKLLFVDDERNILDMLGRMLGQCGESWEGEFCLSVDEALAALHRTEFDTVVADIRMPKKDGFALIEAMRTDDSLRNIPIIVLTGEGDRTLKRRVLEMGATDLLNKPVSREDLIARLRSALRLKEYQDQLENQVDVLDGLVRERTKELEHSHREVVWRLAKAGEYRDDQTGNHVARVAWCSCLLAEGIGMDPEFTELLFQTSPLHDIGKIGIPDRILLKEGCLTPEERAVIERHAEVGESILRQAPKSVALLPHMNIRASLPVGNGSPSGLIKMASIIARHHHEKWNGSGYPDKLVGAEIPIEARIVALADVYDALLSKRPYKPPMGQSDALAIVQEESGRHFDPQIVKSFFDAGDRITEVYERFDGKTAAFSVSEEQREKHSVCG